MPSVLILGGRAPVALDHARRFSRQGWTVHVGDSVSCRLSGWSKAVARTVALAPPRTAPADFVTGLVRAIERHRIDLVLPTCEEVFFLSRYRNKLPAQVRVCVDDLDKLRQLHSKWLFQELALTCGGNPPPSAAVTTIREALDWAGTAPLVLKPEFSRFGLHVRLYPRGVPAKAAELDASRGRWVAQHFLVGKELCSYSVADEGRLLAHAVYHPKYRLGASSGYYFAPRHAPAIRDFVARLVARLGFTGQISFDWIESAEGIHSVIECNPRAVSGVHLFSGDDALPGALAGSVDTCVLPSDPRPRMLGPAMLSVGLLQALRYRNWERWCRDMHAASDVLSISGDRMPPLGGLLDIASFVRQAWRQGCTLREAATMDIEWDGQDFHAP